MNTKQINEYVLPLIQKRVTAKLEDAGFIEPKIYFDQIAHEFDRLTISLIGSIASKELKPKTYRFPTDWWEAFKDRWFPAWAKRRWPPKFTLIEVSCQALYPDLSKKLIIPRKMGRTNIQFFVDEKEGVEFPFGKCVICERPVKRQGTRLCEEHTF